MSPFGDDVAAAQLARIRMISGATPRPETMRDDFLHIDGTESTSARLVKSIPQRAQYRSFGKETHLLGGSILHWGSRSWRRLRQTWPPPAASRECGPTDPTSQR